MSRLWARIRSKDKTSRTGSRESQLPRPAANESDITASVPDEPASTVQSSAPSEDTRTESNISDSIAATDNPATTAENVPITTTADNVPNLQARLWNEAYDLLKKDSPKLMDAYERILSSKLENDESTDASSTNGDNRIIQSQDARYLQMEKLARTELQRTERIAAIKGKAQTGLDIFKITKGIVQTALQSVPQAAVAWAGVCVGLEILANPISESKSNRSGIEYVITRMNWYWNLVLLLLDENLTHEPSLKVQHEVEQAIVQMYQKVLLYQAQSICIYSRHWLVQIGKDILKLDDWDGKLKEIKDAEAIVEKTASQYNVEVIKTYLADTLKSSNAQQEELKLIQQSIQAQTQTQTKQLDDIYSVVQDGIQKMRLQDFDEKDEKCLHDIAEIDPWVQKGEIEHQKGGLLKDSYIWVTEHEAFQQLIATPSNETLWIKGDPGKGKTMLMCGIIDELQKSSKHQISYFFCQKVKAAANNATAVLRGLIFSLVSQQLPLIKYVQSKYKARGSNLFEGDGAFVSLRQILLDMIQSPEWKAAIIMVDALDECAEGRARLLQFILETCTQKTTTDGPSIKWIISSRNWIDIEEALRPMKHTTRLELELNQELVSKAIRTYIIHKANVLAGTKQYDDSKKQQVIDYLIQHANGTYLWVALVCERLGRVASRKTIAVLETYPEGLDSMYQRMIQDVGGNEDADICKDILRTVAIACRPISLKELRNLLPSLEEFEMRDLEEIIGYCGSFLTLRDEYPYFIHQSANDFWLHHENTHDTFPLGIGQHHYALFTQSLAVLESTLKRDMYNLKWPGILLKDIQEPDPNPLEGFRYLCSHWADHLDRAQSTLKKEVLTDVSDGGRVHYFLQHTYLFWIESLCLIRDTASGLKALSILDAILRVSGGTKLRDFIQDAIRFLRYSRSGIAQAPLQIYASGLTFSPYESIIRKTFAHDKYDWISLMSQVETTWGACLEILLGDHQDTVYSIVCFTEDMFASCSKDGAIKVWNANGDCLHTLVKHTRPVYSMTVTSDKRCLCSTSFDETALEWDLTTGDINRSIELDGTAFRKVAKSSPNLLFISLDENNVAVSDSVTDSLVQTFSCNEEVSCLAYLAASRRFAFVYDDERTDILIATKATDDNTPSLVLKGPDEVLAIAVTNEGELLAASYIGNSIQIWDTRTGECTCTLAGHEQWIRALDFSPDAKLLASGSDDTTVKVWNLESGSCTKTFRGYLDRVTCVAFSLDGLTVIAGSVDRTIRIWDVVSKAPDANFDCHTGWINEMCVSHNELWLASASVDETVKLWDPITARCAQTLQGHTGGAETICFSSDDQILLAGCGDGLIKIWNLATFTCIQTFAAHENGVDSAAFSSDGQSILSTSIDDSIRIWNFGGGGYRRTLHTSNVCKAIFSPDDQRVVSSHYENGSVRLWDVATAQQIQVLGKHHGFVLDILFSQDSQLLMTSTGFDQVKIWDMQSYACLHVLDDYCGTLGSVAAWVNGQMNNFGKYMLGSEAQSTPTHTRFNKTSRVIVKDDRMVLYLPTEYTPSNRSFIETESFLAFCLLSGRVIFISIKDSN